MACYFLEKLAPELRNRIYEYVLDFDDVPLHHAKQLQPFVKKLTGVDGELPFAFEDQVAKDSALTWLECDGLPSLDIFPVNTGILSTSRLIYTEAVKVFYDLNVFSIDIELFKLEQVTSPAGSDLSLAKRLLVKFNGSHNAAERYSRKFNTIDMSTIFPRVQAMFPKLQQLHVQTDGTAQPSSALFDIGEDCHKSPVVQRVKFDRVGSFVAETHLGFTLSVKFKGLVDLWQKYAAMSFEEIGEARSRVSRTSDSMSVEDLALTGYQLKNLAAQMVLQDDTVNLKRLTDIIDNAVVQFNKTMDETHKPCSVEDHAFWTWISGGYQPYDYQPYSNQSHIDEEL